MDLYVDGNISQMTGPEDAARYFARLLGVDPRSLRPTVSQNWPYAFFIATSPAVQNARPHLDINGRPLDYAISQAGTVVPQSMWSSNDPTDGQRYATVALKMPIFFVPHDRVTLGLPLVRAVEGSCANIVGAGDTAPIGDNSTLYIRIRWPGYSDWRSQIMTRNQTSDHGIISLEKFAKRVASAVDRFFDEAGRHGGQDPNWQVGAGGITKDQVILVGAVHVSQGSWQPILQLNRYVVPRRQHIPGLP